MTMNSRERMLAALKRERPDRPPTFEWFIDRSVLQALTGTDDLLDAVDALDIDGVNIRADYARTWKDSETYVDEWGIEKRLTGDVLAAATSFPIAELANHWDYEFPKPDGSFRFGSLEQAVKKFGDRRAVVFNLRDGFSDMRDLLGYENALMGLALDKTAWTDLLKRVVEYNLSLAEIAVKRYGIEIVATTDDICTNTGPILSPKSYREVVYPLFRDVIQGFRSLGLFVIKHCDGNVRPFVDLWIDAGISCLDPIDPGAGLDMREMKEKYGDKICLKGNIDCTGNLCNGTPEQVADEVRRCIEKGGPNGLIVSSSNTIHRGVKPENYRAMLDTLHEY